MADNKIFVSYRRQDASGEAGRLVDHLQEIYGEDSVFLDVETLEAGLDFIQAIEKALNSCKVLIAMIGPHWLNIQDAEGNQRIFNEGDFIRIEISAALKRDIRVIPVLVNGAVMPTADQLPEDLQGLTRRHAQEISSSRWKYDCDQLVAALSKIIEPKPQPVKPTPITPNRAKKKSWLAKNYLWLLGGLVGLILLIQLLSLPEEDPIYDDFEENTELANGLSQPTEKDSPPAIVPEENPTTTQDNSFQEPSNTFSTEEVYVDEITGFWLLSDPQGNTSTLVFNQYDDSVEFLEYNIYDVEVGEGNGTISGTQLTADYYNSLVQISGKLILNTSNAGGSWVGTISFPTLGTTTNVSLQRINP